MLPLREIHNVKTPVGVGVSSPEAGKAKWSNHSHREHMSKRDAIAKKSGLGSDGHPGTLSGGSDGVAPLSSSPTRFLSRLTLEASLDDRPQPSDTPTQKAGYQSEAAPSSSPCARRKEGTPRATASKQKRRQSCKPVSPVVAQITAAIAQQQPKQPTRHAPAVLAVIEDSSYETSDELPHAYRVTSGGGKPASPTGLVDGSF
ncbi:hypothetical protein Trco_002707 [Trichoderma cornu-damae]|uniref:Uncharacterized protein n=1 Tax=Trichoderma cornu-damae TaxID=654480 RepID=A0A9P8QQF6_9HYPO|nr:hypothetical protein Trco_002707 [Trichoderma cornu-damae]